MINMSHFCEKRHRKKVLENFWKLISQEWHMRNLIWSAHHFHLKSIVKLKILKSPFWKYNFVKKLRWQKWGRKTKYNKKGSKTPLHNFPLYNIRLNPLSGRISVIEKGLSKMSISFWNAFDFQFLTKSFFHRSANQKRKLGEIKNHTRRIYYTTKLYV